MMPRNERAKQFMPFDGVKGLREALAEVERRHDAQPKRELSEEAAQYLDDDMLTELKHRAESLSPFTTDFTLKKSICIEDQNTIGAALRFVRDYMDGICGRV